ncbi:hypothetical protein [Fodinicola acaciae]|uniref:hypothetical protein n=1 Tax=Fodinicola acaciae TaxID=2681555 RepID=UPI0013D781D2|nr:hypothetical protein [Fodinicola acaciae]
MSRLIAICGGVVAVLAGFGAGVLEAFLIPLRAGVVRLPVAVLVALVVHVGIALWTRYVTGSRLAPIVPAISWFAAVAVLGTRTPAGDIVIVGSDWVALTTVFVGAIGYAIGLFLAARPGPAPAESAGPPDRG